MQRRRPAPTPTIEEETTCVVDTGPPIIDAPRMIAEEADWLARPSTGWIR